jgi:peptide subunit release factor 1 (eRF1)
VVLAIEPYLAADRARESEETVKLMRDRVSQDYLATAGFQSTLTALQEGKVDTLVIAEDQELDGTRCSQCGFVFARELDFCPYDGAPATNRVNVVEEAVRMAEAQGAEVRFVPAATVQDLRGVGALLRF